MSDKQPQSLYLSFLLLNFILWASWLNNTPVAAQSIDSAQTPRNNLPNPIPRPQPIPSPIPKPETLPPPSELLQPGPLTPTPAPEQLPNIPGSITVEKFEFEGNTAFSDRQLTEVTKPFTGRPITFAELLQARSAVTDLYVKKGYITSGAYIPPQTLSGGTVIIQVVEGQIEEIQVSGTGRLNPNYVRDRIKLGTSTPLNVNHLLEALQVLQLNPLIKNISAELAAGSRPGYSVLQVTVKPARSYNASINLDNGRNPSIGSFQRGIVFTEANLLGQGDSITVSYTNTNGSNEVVANYTYPVNARNGTVAFDFSYIQSRIIEPPFDELDIKARSRDYAISFRQPLILTPSTEFALGAGFFRRESDTELLGVPFPLSPGANDEGQTRITALRFFQEYTQRNSREVLAARSQFSLGVGSFDATVNKDAPDSRFFAWRGQGQYLRLLGSGNADATTSPLLLLRADIQLANRALLPFEQFGLGGLYSVEGYRQDFLLTDNGVFGSAEVRFPVYRISKIQGLFQVIPFVQVGKGWNSSGRQNPDPNTLASVGIGLQFQASDRIRARLDYAIPLVHVDYEKGYTTLQDEGIFFNIQVNLF